MAAPRSGSPSQPVDSGHLALDLRPESFRAVRGAVAVPGVAPLPRMLRGRAVKCAQALLVIAGAMSLASAGSPKAVSQGAQPPTTGSTASSLSVRLLLVDLLLHAAWWGPFALANSAASAAAPAVLMPRGALLAFLVMAARLATGRSSPLFNLRIGSACGRAPRRSWTQLGGKPELCTRTPSFRSASGTLLRRKQCARALPPRAQQLHQEPSLCMSIVVPLHRFLDEKQLGGAILCGGKSCITPTCARVAASILFAPPPRRT